MGGYFYGVIVMALKPWKPCRYSRCPSLTRDTHCEGHLIDKHNDRADDQRFYDRYRRDERSTKFYKSKEWRKIRPYVFGLSHGLCDQCRGRGIITSGSVVDHKTPLKRDYSLRLTISNLWTLCHDCHNKKTRSEW